MYFNVINIMFYLNITQRGRKNRQGLFLTALIALVLLGCLISLHTRYQLGALSRINHHYEFLNVIAELKADLAGSVLIYALIAFFLVRTLSDSSLRRKTANMLYQSEMKYRSLVENAAAVIYSTNAQGLITFINDKATDLTGYSKEELLGMHFSILIDPSGLTRVSEAYIQQFRTGMLETTQVFMIVTKSGEKKWVSQSAVLLKEGLLPVGFQCIVKDISEERQMQLELEASEFRLKENQLWLQSILDNTTSQIFIKDLAGKYILVNRRFRELLNVMERNVIGHTDHDFIPGETADHYKRQDDEVIRTGRSVEIEELIHTRDGDRNFLLIKFPLLDQGNHIFGIGGIATDITERAHYQQELISARKAAEEAEQMQEQFLANMSHEIRTPMNGIQGMTNLLLDTALTDQQKEFANIIRTSSGNLLVIINDILDFSKIKAGKLTLEKVDFKLKDILENVKGVLEHRIRKKGLEFRSEIDPRIPAALRGDPFRLNQILLNLVGNAIKFTDHGQILVKISQQDHTDKGVTLLFSVADTGIGISEGDLPHIFDSFSQAGLDITRRYGGTGLGLAICSQLVSLQQGGIRAESREGIGSKFEFWLHYDHSTDPEQEQVVAGNILDHRAALKGRRFLVAEDNEVNQKLIEYVLKKAGAIVTIARNGQEAIDELNRTSDYDIVIMDLQMPVMDGYEATRHIREEMKNPIPIVAMTATALKGEQLRCLEAGMNAYMTKPFEFTDMYKCMAGQLTKRSAAGPDLHDRIKVDDGKLYDLSLLQEMDDNEYLLDILQTFLSNTPGQVKEMRTAANIRDFETVYYISHKLKGSVSMFRSATLQDLLQKIEAGSRERKDTTALINSFINIYQHLEQQLVAEKTKVEALLRIQV